MKGVNSPAFEELLEKRIFVKNLTTGEAADKRAALRESVTAWLFWDLGLGKVNPETLGIPRLAEFEDWWPPEGYEPRLKGS